MNVQPLGPILDSDQQARAEAARLARDILVPRTIAGAGKPDAWDVQHLAEWIVYGPDADRWSEILGADLDVNKAETVQTP